MASTPTPNTLHLPPAERPVVAVYRDVLLNPNEPYIRTQAEAMRRYRGYYVGMRRVPGPDLPTDRTVMLNDGGVVGRASEAAFKVLGVSPTLVHALRPLRPALIHAHTGIDGAVALPLARRLRTPLVVTFHGYDATATDDALRRGSRRSHAFLRRREDLKREARLFIAVSEFIHGNLLERGWPEDKIVLHYMGVDTEFFCADPAIPREPVVLLVGRLVEKKGAPHLIAAMREVQARVPAAELVIAGDGPMRKRLEQQAREAGVRCRFLGRVTPEEVRGWMNRARVLCAPSVTAANGDSEGLPTVIVEAQAMALPVVASVSAGIPEAISHGENGLLAAEGDRGALATHLTALLTDAPLWERMSAAAVQRVRERFDVRRQTAALEDLYDAARLGRAGPA